MPPILRQRSRCPDGLGMFEGVEFIREENAAKVILERLQRQPSRQVRTLKNIRNTPQYKEGKCEQALIESASQFTASK